MPDRPPLTRHQQRWTPAEEGRLAFLWGQPDLGVEQLAARLQRSEKAVVRRAERLGLGPAHRGRTTIAELVRTSGWGWQVIDHALRALRLRGNQLRKRRTAYPRSATETSPRAERGRIVLLTEPQVAQVLAWCEAHGDARRLPKILGVDLPPCPGPGCRQPTGLRHRARGFCSCCYDRWLKQQGGRIVQEPRPCAVCGTMFVPGPEQRCGAAVKYCPEHRKLRRARGRLLPRYPRRGARHGESAAAVG